MYLIDNHLGESLPNILRDESTSPATSKIEFFVTTVNGKTSLTNVTRRSIIDAAGIKVKKNNKSDNCKIMSTTTNFLAGGGGNIAGAIFLGVGVMEVILRSSIFWVWAIGCNFMGVNFLKWGNFPRGFFSRGIFLETN